MTNIILCGGSGTRLWPISRTLMPKQFVKLFSNQSLFQLTVKRNSSICARQYIVSNTEQYFLALDQLEELSINKSSFLLEPVGRNTAPAIALACFSLADNDIVLVTPSDHLIKDEEEYKRVVDKAKKFALKDYLVTFGIVPSSPETGFGYIKADSNNVISFHEKPDLETAKHYLSKGNYFWNSGLFCFKAGVFLSELKKHSPTIYEASMLAYKNAKKSDIIRITTSDMLNIPEDSIDYAVMEKSGKVKVIVSDVGWSDLGSFDSLYNELPKDNYGNTICDSHIAIESKNNMIYGKKRKIVTIDIEDLIVIDTEDALLITKRGSSQKVKDAVKIVSKNTDLHNIHLTTHRPWGTYTILEESPNYKIKRIVVKPGKRLSLQKHYHRSEHWVVVSGTATVTVGEETYLVRPNESTYINMGEIHRLENRGKIPIILIEAQVGEYIDEDDIIRIEDDFQR